MFSCRVCDHYFLGIFIEENNFTSIRIFPVAFSCLIVLLHHAIYFWFECLIIKSTQLNLRMYYAQLRKERLIYQFWRGVPQACSNSWMFLGYWVQSPKKVQSFRRTNLWIRGLPHIYLQIFWQFESLSVSFSH